MPKTRDIWDDYTDAAPAQESWDEYADVPQGADAYLEQDQLPQKKSWADTGSDVAASLVKGTASAGRGLVGLADFFIPGDVTGAVRKLDEVITPASFREATAKAMELSPEQKADYAVRSAAFKKGFIPGMVEAIKRPSTIGYDILESVPSMATGGIYGRTLSTATKMAPAVAGAAGEGLVGLGSAHSQIMDANKGVTPTNAQMLNVLSSGAGTMAFGVIGNKLSQRLGVTDIDTAMAGGRRGVSIDLLGGIAPKKGLFKRVAEGAVAEGVFEEAPQSAWEQMMINRATGKPLFEGIGEAIGTGLLAGGVMGAGMNVRSNTSKTELLPNTESQDQEQEAPPPGAPPSDSPIRGTSTVNSGGKKSQRIYREDGSQDIDGVQVVPPGAPTAPPSAYPTLTDKFFEDNPDIARPAPPATLGGLTRPSAEQLAAEDAKRQEEMKAVEEEKQTRVATLDHYGADTVTSPDGTPIGTRFGGKIYNHTGDPESNPQLVAAINKTIAADLAVVTSTPELQSVREKVLNAAKESGFIPAGAATPTKVDSLVKELNLTAETPPATAVQFIESQLATLEGKKSESSQVKRDYFNALLPQFGGKPKEVQDAVQERSATQEVPRAGTAGQVVTEGGEGVGQVEQRTEVAPEGKAKKVTAPSPVYNESGEIVSGGRTQEELKAQFNGAAARLMGKLTRNARANIVPEEDADVMRELVAMVDAAIGLGHISLKQAAKYVLDSLGLSDADLSPDLLKTAHAIASKQRGIKASRGVKGSGEVSSKTLDEVPETMKPVVMDFMGLDENGDIDPEVDPMTLRAIAAKYGEVSHTTWKKRLADIGFAEADRQAQIDTQTTKQATEEAAPDQRVEEGTEEVPGAFTQTGELIKDDEVVEREPSEAGVKKHAASTDTGLRWKTDIGKAITKWKEPHLAQASAEFMAQGEESGVSTSLFAEINKEMGRREAVRLDVAELKIAETSRAEKAAAAQALKDKESAETQEKHAQETVKQLPKQQVQTASRMWTLMTGKPFGNLTAVQQIAYTRGVESVTSDSQVATEQDFDRFLANMHNAFLRTNKMEVLHADQSTEAAGAQAVAKNEGAVKSAEDQEAVRGSARQVRPVNVEVRKKRVIDKTKLSETAGAENPISAESLTSRLKEMFRAAPLFDKIVTVYATQAEAMKDLIGGKFSVIDINARLEAAEDAEDAALVKEMRDYEDIQQAKAIVGWFERNRVLAVNAKRVLDADGFRLTGIAGQQDDATRALRKIDAAWDVLAGYVDAGIATNLRHATSELTGAREALAGYISAATDAAAQLNRRSKFEREIRLEVENAIDTTVRFSESGRIQGFKTTDGKIGLIAENIEDGEELGIFLHEVGVHLGLEKLIGKNNMAWLDTRVRAWAKKNDGSPESVAAKAAIARSEKSTTDDNAEGRIAYMVEELSKAGITPQAVGTSPSHVWFRRLWAATKVALRKLGFKRADFSGQDLINLAYGAAHIELEGAWHGTAADFRKFHHAYMGSGEGAQAYGWGTYLAQREGIGRDYMKKDVRRKTSYSNDTVLPPPDLTDSEKQMFNRIAKDFGHDTRYRWEKYVYEDAPDELGESDLAMVQSLYQKISDFYRWKKEGPEGSLMRVASSVREDEFLDWDKPLSEQSEKVKAALEENGWYTQEGMSGEALQRAMWKHYGSKEAASKYLDSIGIKGIKFLDATSRNATTAKNIQEATLRVNRAEKALQVQESRAKEMRAEYPDLDAATGPIQYKSRGIDRALKAAQNEVASAKAVLSAYGAVDEKQTRNLVIFNDKNIVRAVTYPGGKKESPVFSEKEAETKRLDPVNYKSFQAMGRAEAFIKKQGLYKTVSKAKMEDGTYDVVRIKLEPKEGTKYSEAAPRSTVAQDSPSKGVWEKAGAAFDRFFNDPLTMVKEHGLGWLSMDHLVEVSQGVNDKLSEYRDVSRKMQAMSKEWVYKAAKIDAEWGKLSDVEAKNLSRVMRAATRAGFDPETKAVPTTSDDLKIKSLYAKLTPAAVKVYKAARDHYASARVERQRIASGVLAAAHESLIKSAKESGDKAKIEKAEAKLKSQLERLDEKYRKVKGPYFPLMRLGKWYVVGMSKELAALEAIDEPSKSDQAKIAAMRSTEKHYTTSSYETKSRAQAAQKVLAKKYAETRFNRAEEKSHAAGVLSAAGLQDVEQYINSSFDKEVASEIRTMMAELYYEALPEHHALKREMKREGIYGEEEDMRRVFAVSTIKSAHYMSRLKYSDDLKSALYAIRREGKKSSDAMQYYNEVVKLAKLSMDETSAPWADKIAAVSYLAHLGLNPAFVLTNASQVAMITAPWLAARTSVGKATAAIGSAYRVAGDLIMSSYKEQGWRAELDWGTYDESTKKWTKLKVPEGVANMLLTLLKRNLLDITIEHDLGATAELKHHALGDALKIGNLPVHITELANRTVTAIAAYNLAINELKVEQVEAEEFASKAVSATQLDYSALNAPRHMQRVLGSASAARIVMQFRKYQQGMLWLIGRSMYNALKGATPKDRREARRTLFGLFTTTGVMAGSLGVPLAGTTTWVLTALAGLGGDDDEPWDARTEYLNWLTESVGKDAAIAIAKGIPAWMFGIDLEKRIGMGDIASPLPFMRQGKTAQEDAANALLAAAGAPVGTMVDIWDGVSMMGQGDWWKGAEKVVPMKGIQNLSRGARYGMEGMTERDGDTILPPNAFSIADIGVKMAGFATTKESVYYEATSAVKGAQQAAMNVRKKLLGDYAQARIAGEDTTDIVDEMKSFNSRHPEKGLRIDGSSRVKAVQARRLAVRQRGESGLLKNKQAKPFLKEASFAE